jgi:hypothetical protein
MQTNAVRLYLGVYRPRNGYKHPKYLIPIVPPKSTRVNSPFDERFLIRETNLLKKWITSS